MSPPLIAVVGGCGGAGASLIGAAMALVVADRGAPLTLLDADAAGVHAALAGIEPARGTADLCRLADGLTADHLRTASFPHPRAGALIPASPTSATADLAALTGRLAGIDDRPPLVVDCGSGPAAARLVPEDVACVLVITRDAAGLRAAEATHAALPAGRAPIVVVNEGVRRGDVGHRAAARVVGAGEHVRLGHADRDAQRVTAGYPPGRRSAFGRTITDLCVRCGFIPLTEDTDG